MHRQYLASIAPFNILFRNSTTTSTDANNLLTSSLPEGSNLSAVQATVNRSVTSSSDMEYLDFSIDTHSNCSGASDDATAQSTSAFTQTRFITNNGTAIKIKKSRRNDLGIQTAESNKCATVFSIENIIRKD